MPRSGFKFCKENIPIAQGTTRSRRISKLLSLAQAIYVLGDDRYGKMFPKEAKESWLTWSGYTLIRFIPIC